MIEVMQLSEMRVLLGHALVQDLPKDAAKDGAAAFVAELDPMVEDKALDVAEVVPDGSGLMAATPVAAFPDLRIPVKPEPDAMAVVLAVQVAGDAGRVGFDQAGGVVDGLSPLHVAANPVVLDAKVVGERVAADPLETLADPGGGEVPIPAALIDVGQRPDLTCKDSSLKMREQGAQLPSPIPEPMIAGAAALDTPASDGGVPVPVSETKAESRWAAGPVTPPPASRVDSGTMIVPDAALVVVVPVVPVTAFPLSRQTATEFRWTESARVERPVVAMATAAGPTIGPVMPLNGAVSLSSVPVVEASPVTGPVDQAKAEPGPESLPAVAIKDLSLAGGDLLLVVDGDALRLDRASDLTLPSLTPLQDIQQSLPPALRDTPMRIAPEVVTQQVAHLVLSHAEDRAELLLEPAELGRLRFEITQRGEGVQIVVMAERPETMDLLRRHADQLLDDLQTMGFSGSALGFGNWNGPPEQTPAPLPDEGMVQMPLPAPMLFSVAPQPRGAAGGLDLRL